MLSLVLVDTTIIDMNATASIRATTIVANSGITNEPIIFVSSESVAMFAPPANASEVDVIIIVAITANTTYEVRVFILWLYEQTDIYACIK